MKPVRALLIILALGACTTPLENPGEAPPPGYRPALETEEAGLWLEMDQAEQALRTSSLLVRDPQLNAYVRGLVCRLAGPRCKDVRVYLMRVPEFNASMAPNGVMQVWTGLLLRAENEAQLVYVLGHELGHYLRRHTLQAWRDVRRKSDLFTYFGLLTGVVGAPGYVQDVAQLATIGSILKFSRDAEREADEIGFELATAAGYDAREAAKLWRALLRERDAEKAGSPWIFFSTHPAPEERADTLERRAAATQPGTAGVEPYRAALASWRAALLGDELRLRRFERTQVLLERLRQGGTGLGELQYFQGEFHRLRAKPGDEEQAKAAYRKALQHPDVPAEAYRALGLQLLKSGDRQEAHRLLARYLELKPDAEDRAMVRSYLERAP
jgi:predicted Zn-dependent protease